MNHSRSMPEFVEQGMPAPDPSDVYRKSFDGDAKGFQKSMLAGDTRQAEMFVRDQLTTGFAPPSSPLADILPIQGSSKPQAKYDPNTGKFYRSVVVDPSCIPDGLPATQLMALFCSDEMRYNPSTHTGVVLNLSFTITVTCVGDTHVQADDMHHKVQNRVAALILGSFPSAAAAEEAHGEVQTCMGMSLFGAAAHMADEECELVADSCAGISLFAPVNAPAKQIKAIKAIDSCMGMTMFTADDDDLSEEGTASPRSATGSLSSFTQFVADTCAGMTLFGGSKPAVDLEDLVADGVMGMTLYSPKEQQGAYDVRAETCNGVTTFTRCAAAEETGDSAEEFEGEDLASSCVGGFTDFTPALRRMQQDPSQYTKEQQWMSELAWGAAY